MKTLDLLKLIFVFSMLFTFTSCEEDNENDLNQEQTIAGLAASNTNLTALNAAITAAGLDGTLDNPEANLTVFAPNNAAFAALLDGSSIDDVPVEDLAAILLNHVVEGSVLSGDLEDGQEIQTLGQATFTVSIQGSTVMIGDATVVGADVEASNGVVHIIDEVLMVEEELPTIVELAQATDDLSTLVSAVVKAGLVETLSGGEYTVFAPVNSAFEGVDLDALSAEEVSAILLDHVVEGTVLSTDLSDGMEVTTLGGAKYMVSIGESVMIGNATVAAADQMASNGVVHVVDMVLMEEEMLPTIVELAQATEDLSTLVSAVVKAGLVETLSGGEYTVFAPLNSAFEGVDLDALSAEEVSAILLDHVVEGTVLSTDLSDGMEVTTLGGAKYMVSIGESVMIGNATVAAADQMASNGVVHVVDMVLMEEEMLPTIVELAQATEDLSTLVSAVVKAGLVETLSGGEYTVFAPLNSAFEGVDLDALSAEEVSAILLDHVVEGTVLSTDLSDGMEVETLGGAKYMVSIGESVMIGNATVAAADQMASNGVVHVVDMVLMEEEMLPTIVELAQATEDLSTLVSAVVKAGLVETLSGGEYTVFAPLNSAFEGVDLDALTAEEVSAILLDHVVEGTVLSTDLSDGMEVETLGGAKYMVSLGSSVMIGNATVAIADQMALNGVVHVVDMVLMEEEMLPTIVELAQATEDLSTLVSAVVKAGLVETLSGGEYTVFAPVNSAFEGVDLDALTAEEVSAILLDHVVEGTVLSTDLSDGMEVETLGGAKYMVSLGSSVMIGNATVAAADQMASNGVVHVVDMVLMEEEMLPTIVELAQATEDLSTLVSAVVKAGLVETLSGGEYTVFAPVNSAFEGVDLDALTAEEVSAILLDHVVEGTVLSTDLSDGMEVETLGGAKYMVSLGSSVMIGNATVAAADQMASNGLVHVVDMVLMEEEMLPTIVELAQATEDLSTLVSAVVKAGLVETLSGGEYTVFAPVNSAFEGVDLDALTAEEVSAILLDHVVEGTVLSTDLSDGMEVETLGGATYTVSIDGETVMIGNATVSIANNEASNGVVHIINAILDANM